MERSKGAGCSSKSLSRAPAFAASMMIRTLYKRFSIGLAGYVGAGRMRRQYPIHSPMDTILLALSILCRIYSTWLYPVGTRSIPVNTITLAIRQYFTPIITIAAVFCLIISRGLRRNAAVMPQYYAVDTLKYWVALFRLTRKIFS